MSKQYQKQKEKWKQEGRDEMKADFKKMIEDVDIELMFTDVKNNVNEKYQFSKEIMEIITIWWNDKSKELLTKLGDDEVKK